MTDIVKIIGSSVHLDRQGKNYVGFCPLHSEKTPSFTVDPSAQTFRCLGCGAQGDAEEFAKQMLMKGLTAVLNVNLHVAPDFTGRVVVQLKEGRHVCDYPLVNGEHIATLPSFLEMAQRAGWSVTSEQGVKAGHVSKIKSLVEEANGLILEYALADTGKGKLTRT